LRFLKNENAEGSIDVKKVFLNLVLFLGFLQPVYAGNPNHEHHAYNLEVENSYVEQVHHETHHAAHHETHHAAHHEVQTPIPHGVPIAEGLTAEELQILTEMGVTNFSSSSESHSQSSFLPSDSHTPQVQESGISLESIKESVHHGLPDVFCFPEETLVSVKEGSGYFAKPIAEVQVGEWVASCNLNIPNGSCEFGQVQKVIERTTEHLFKLTFSNQKEIRSTGNHPFYVVEKNNWVEAQDLEEGQHFLTLTGEEVTLESKEEQRGDFLVYNLEVQGHENYYACDVLVHNCSGSVGISPVALTVTEGAALTEGLILAGEAALGLGPVVAAGLTVGGAAYIGHQLYEALHHPVDSTHGRPIEEPIDSSTHYPDLQLGHVGTTPPTLLPQEDLLGNSTHLPGPHLGDFPSSSSTHIPLHQPTLETVMHASGSGGDSTGQGSSESTKGSIEKVSDRQLEKLGIDAHGLKKDFLGKKAKISEYDIYKNKKTGELELYKKGVKGEGIPTGEYFK